MSHWTMYFFVKLDNFISLFGHLAFFVTIGSVVFLALGIAWIMDDAPKELKEVYMKKVKKYGSIGLSIGIFSLLMWVALPSTKQMAAIYVVPKMANNEDFQEIAGNSIDILKEYTRQWLEELTETKGDK